MFTALLSLILPALVSAHGFVGKVTIDDTDYLGNPVGTTPTIPSIVRQVNTNSPVVGATNPELNCGPGAYPASEIAGADPGSFIQVYWYGGTSGPAPWVHDKGPILHYMTKCDGSCAYYDSSVAEWFKISEEGREYDNVWYQGELMKGYPANVTIPSNLAPGEYLLRSELIALHKANVLYGAEFFASCIQLSVGGSETGQPAKSDEVTIPGAYSDRDPGILVDVYTPPFNNYVFPGPPVASLIPDSDSNEFSGPSNILDGVQTLLDWAGQVVGL